MLSTKQLTQVAGYEVSCLPNSPTYMYTHTNTHIHTRTHTRTHTHTHARTHAHTHTSRVYM